MNSLTDQQLLRDYVERRSEAAFAELVRRHVDLVYSAAARMVRDVHLAEDVTQNVFVAFAKDARELASRPVLSGWLHRTTQNIAAQMVRTDGIVIILTEEFDLLEVTFRHFISLRRQFLFVPGSFVFGDTSQGFEFHSQWQGHRL